MDYQNEPMCPHCDGLVLETECYDTDYNDDEHIRKCIGKCSKCGKDIVFYEYYEYKGARIKREA